MALGILLVVFVTLAIVSLISILLLFLVKDPRINHIFFIVTVILGIVISYMNFTSIASNMFAPRVIAVVFSILLAFGVILRYMGNITAAKILTAASVVLGCLQLFFF
ncbi:hypothetical protein [Paenibacillus segetis]|uniref:YesK-like protein n=1 Tax=Paenibacillus segetis TaxID=1325360 RepID=A0ABQ1Y841_9BACL|nr:hypothetical protein [Paenibacillus segetis]GGH16196.1 hypothetical protein GCM10008013_10830 [Paenibacillus segetis]